MTCALNWVLPVIAAFQFTQHPDAIRLRQAALRWHIPPSLMWSVAYEETRHSAANDQWSVKSAYGRMQITPAIWEHYPPCRNWWLYHENINCGAFILRYYANICHNHWLCVAYRYVGRDMRYAKAVDNRRLITDIKLGSFASYY